MPSTDPSDPVPRNLLLAALPRDNRDRLLPSLRPVELTSRQLVYEPEIPIKYVYFIETGYISMLAYMEDGDAAEVGLIGREGIVGLPVFLGAEYDELEAVVQSDCLALRMDVDPFRHEVDENPELRQLLLRFTLAHMSQLTRTAACNGRHHTEQRLARWLLMADDRTEGDDYPMTHEFLSMMLGVRRAGISVAAGQLQRAGFIRYERGRMHITDRAGLESAACECYGFVRRAYDRLLGPPSGSRVPYRR